MQNQNLNRFWGNKSRYRKSWLIMGCCGCLTFVGHEIWRVLKFILAALAFVGAVITFFNIICNVYILREVVAAVLAVSALFMMIDSAGIEAVLNQFRFEIHRLGDEVDRLQDIEEELKQTSHELSEQLKQGANLLAQEKILNEGYAQQNEGYAQNNAQLSTELAKFQDQNHMLDATIKAQQIQIQRLVLIEQNAERMISSLMQAGDNFDHFGEILSKSVKEMEDINTAMERLLKELTHDKFQTIDENRDGVITQQELEDYARKREPDDDFHN